MLGERAGTGDRWWGRRGRGKGYRQDTYTSDAGRPADISLFTYTMSEADGSPQRRHLACFDVDGAEQLQAGDIEGLVEGSGRGITKVTVAKEGHGRVVATRSRKD